MAEKKSVVMPKEHKERLRLKVQYFDYSLLLIVILLFAFGMVMLYSTSAYTATIKYDNPMVYLRKQAIASALGFVAMFFMIKLDYHILLKFSWLLYVVSFLLCVAVIFVGTSLNNSSRWLNICGVSVQPSEIAKVAIIIFYATLISKTSKSLGNFKKLFYAFAFSLPFLAVIGYNNLSTAIIIMGIAFVMLFVASSQKKFFIFSVMLLGFLFILLLLLQGYRSDRIAVWLNPEKYDTGFQTLQGLYAIGSGGLIGKGLGASMQKLGFVPEAQNDMIFSIICEELGLVGAVALIVLYLLLIWRFMVIAMNAKDLFGSFLVIGIMTHIILQVILNIAVVTNTIPNTGITLPFISYGGTSISILLGEIGIVLSVSKGITLES